MMKNSKLENEVYIWADKIRDYLALLEGLNYRRDLLYDMLGEVRYSQIDVKNHIARIEKKIANIEKSSAELQSDSVMIGKYIDLMAQKSGESEVYTYGFDVWGDIKAGIGFGLIGLCTDYD